MEAETTPVTCLDTSALIDAMRNQPEARRAVEEAAETGVVTTEVNVYELFVGAHRAGRMVASEVERIRRGLDEIEVLNLVRPASIRAAALTSALRSRGGAVGVLDVLVAAIALVHGVTRILTRDVADFRRIPGLHVETY